MRNNIDFVQNEYIQVGATSKNCLRILPFTTKKNQQCMSLLATIVDLLNWLVVIGDTSGTINVFEFNKGELSLDFKSTPVQKEISRIELGGSNYSARDKIYFSAGTFLRGYSRKGKEIFKLDTYLTETIKSFGIEENRLWTAGVFSSVFQ